ncbi:hypothetical protein [Pseudomarimonas arenosa]|uniref:Anti sigma-E protein RseA N-terminal domain-containing protein n=1 Tax=Pseudomarimonas arenosa TaxID=2774145 RepID=A0AAW3ZG33_9GAMM|nr:hypothetical protein [Pseudomarimonas arenosa]MBD8524986.1 hypothetical protein [Pseudomarimonas arenosa]
MNEEQIRQIWQSRARSGAAMDQAAQIFSDRADQRAAGVAAVAADARAAVLARVVLALREDAEALERGVAQLRRPKLLKTQFRWAMAASLGALAVLFGALQFNPSAPPMHGDEAVNVTQAEKILTGSFESTGGDTPATADAAPNKSVFSAGFDS